MCDEGLLGTRTNSLPTFSQAFGVIIVWCQDFERAHRDLFVVRFVSVSVCNAKFGTNKMLVLLTHSLLLSSKMLKVRIFITPVKHFFTEAIFAILKHITIGTGFFLLEQIASRKVNRKN